MGRRLADFLSARHGAATHIAKLKRFTVGFSWLTYGFEASWSQDGIEQRRDLILRIGPPNGIFAPGGQWQAYIASSTCFPGVSIGSFNS